MATSKFNAQNVMIEQLGPQQFRTTPFDAPAVEHRRLPISFVGVANPDEFDLGAENLTLSVDCTAHQVNVQLPSASGINGKRYTVKNRAGTNHVVVVPFGSEHIDNSTSVTLTNALDSITVEALDNDVETGWIIVAVFP